MAGKGNPLLFPTVNGEGIHYLKEMKIDDDPSYPER
jgi:hypothetical protein